MKLVLISDTTNFPNEGDIINSLFHEGLQILHLRKPTFSSNELEKLISEIHPDFHSKIALHQHYHLTKTFDIKKIHLPETIRKNSTTNDFTTWENANYSLSTSIHKIEDYETLSPLFEYTFLGPVFDSISKQNYKASDSILKEINTIQKTNIQIIAIGGISIDKLNFLKKTAFDGIGILGSIWQSKNPVKEFVTLYETCRQLEIMY